MGDFTQLGCTNPAAVNYDETKSIDDGSCIYLTKVDGVCYAFQDYGGVTDKSFTLSYALEGDNWVFFHDYIPDFYFHTREKLHPVKSSKIYTALAGPAGQYLPDADGVLRKKPFFIDVIFRSAEEMILNSTSWITEVIDRLAGTNEEFSTLTHITIWNAWQCSSRIPLASVFEALEVENVRKTQSKWSFNEFRDLVATRGATVVGDLFSNFAVNTAALDPGMPWYEKKLMEDNYFVIRFEFDNSADKVVLLHSVDADVTKSMR